MVTPKYLALSMLALLPMLALAEPAPDDVDENRRQFDHWRHDPDHVQRLRHDAQAFFALTEGQRQRIIRLDRDFHQEKPVEQARLERIMERYAQWLAKIDESDRRRIKDAATKTDRLAIIM